MLHIRRETIKNLVAENGSVNVQDLIARFNVSVETIRRDLEALEKAGHIKRVYGGAIAAYPSEDEPVYYWRKEINQEEKEQIAVLAASLIEDGDTVLFSYGTTSLQVAKRLSNKRDLTVITNSLLIATELGDRPGITAYCLGGRVRTGELSVGGILTMQNIRCFNPNKIIMGIGGITPEMGLTDSKLDESHLLQTCVQAVPCVIAVGDHSKFGVVAPYNICPISTVTHLITDDKTPADLLAFYQGMGVNVHVASTGYRR